MQVALHRHAGVVRHAQAEYFTHGGLQVLSYLSDESIVVILTAVSSSVMGKWQRIVADVADVL